MTATFTACATRACQKPRRRSAFWRTSSAMTTPNKKDIVNAVSDAADDLDAVFAKVGLARTTCRTSVART